MGFTKLDDSILTSSIMKLDSATFKVWIAILSQTKPHEEYGGVCRLTIPYIAESCHLSLEQVEQSCALLEAPDKYSRSRVLEGRRLVRNDDGWQVVNYQKYREYSHSEVEAQRKYDERQRRKKVSIASKKEETDQDTDTEYVRTCPDMSGQTTPVNCKSQQQKPAPSPGIKGMDAGANFSPSGTTPHGQEYQCMKYINSYNNLTGCRYPSSPKKTEEALLKLKRSPKDFERFLVAANVFVKKVKMDDRENRGQFVSSAEKFLVEDLWLNFVDESPRGIND